MYCELNIVIPVYNESENIIHTISEIENKISTPYQITIIYDFEDDDTLPAIKDIVEERKNIRIIKNKYGRGVLKAIKTGFDCVDDGVILVIMADMSDDLGNVERMLDKINDGYEIVCGSRYMKGGKQIGGPKIKKLLSRLAGVSLHYLTGIPTHDVTNSFKMYTKKAIKKIEIESDGGFEIGMEVLIKAYFDGLKIGEVPCIWKDRSRGESRFKIIRWLPKYLKWYFYAIKRKFI